MSQTGQTNKGHGLGKKLLLSAVVIGVIGAVVGVGAFSAFSSTTSNGASTISSGTLSISDDDGGSASLFTAANTNLIPGGSVQKCINVTNGGNVPFGTVKLYRNGTLTDTGSLATVVDFTVERGTGATGGTGLSCTGFTGGSTIFTTAKLSTFPSAIGSAISDASGWTAGATKSYRFTAALPAATGNSEQGKTLSALNFTWQADQ